MNTAVLNRMLLREVKGMCNSNCSLVFY